MTIRNLEELARLMAESDMTKAGVTPPPRGGMVGYQLDPIKHMQTHIPIGGLSMNESGAYAGKAWKSKGPN